MGKARRIARKKKLDDALMNKIKTCENRSVKAWSDLNHDVLFLVMMRLVGVVDFLAFSGVCKSWRSLALINRNKFIVSRPPMSISFSNSKCYLQDFEGRKFSTILPHSAKRTCIGVTCGYMILYSKKLCDFWLVNLITMHELHFPALPWPGYAQKYLRGILVFSPSISGWVFAVLNFCNLRLCFSIAGTHEWSRVWHSFSYSGNLHAFNGKIYTLDYDDLYGPLRRIFPLGKLRVHELRLHPEPKLVLVEIERFQKPDLTDAKFVTSTENLYVIDIKDSKHPYMNIHELDFGKMIWVSCENTGEKYVFFCNNELKDIATITLREVWIDLRSQYERYVYNNKNGKGRMFEANMWYFFQDCLNATNIHDW